MRRLTVTKFRERITDLVDEVEVTANGMTIGTWKPSVWQVATHTPPLEGGHPLVLHHLPKAEATKHKPCSARSSITDAPCELEDGHPAWSYWRFHKFPYSRVAAGAPR